MKMSKAWRAMWLTLVVTIAAASPFFWLGFIERRHEWTAAGVAIVLAAKWVPVGRRVAHPQSRSDFR